MLQTGAHMWRHESDDLMFVIDVLVPDSFLAEDIVEKSIGMLTNTFVDNFPDAKKERYFFETRGNQFCVCAKWKLSVQIYIWHMFFIFDQKLKIW